MKSKDMDSRATELRKAIAAAKGGRRNAHVPSDLRKRALELREAGRARGMKARETASALGIHETTLLNWQRELGARTPFVEAKVVGPRRREREVAQPVPARALRVLVIDGLDAATFEALVRSLS